jgi:hypothetical protein
MAGEAGRGRAGGADGENSFGKRRDDRTTDARGHDGGGNRRKRRYGQLLDATSRVVGQAKRFSGEISQGVKRARSVLEKLALEGLRQELDLMASRVRQVMKQTRARIFRGNTRSQGKLLSLFEPSTEVIRKGKAGKPNEFGKMVKLQEAENQIITDYEVYAQRPYDSDLLVAAIETHQALLGRAPRLVAADAAFYSARMKPPQRRQRTEVRAWGVLLDELLERCSPAPAGFGELRELVGACVQPDTTNRPLMADVVQSLEDLSRSGGRSRHRAVVCVSARGDFQPCRRKGFVHLRGGAWGALSVA